MLIPKVLDALECEEIHVAARSSLWRTPAWPDPSEPPYVNASARIETSLSPEALLETLHRLEQQFGRDRRGANRARTIDLDIIDYAGRVERSDSISLPHPRAVQRAFVLLPLQDVAPDWRDPVSQSEIRDLIGQLPDHEVSACQRIR